MAETLTAEQIAVLTAAHQPIVENAIPFEAAFGTVVDFPGEGDTSNNIFSRGFARKDLPTRRAEIQAWCNDRTVGQGGVGILHLGHDYTEADHLAIVAMRTWVLAKQGNKPKLTSTQTTMTSWLTLCERDNSAGWLTGNKSVNITFGVPYTKEDRISQDMINAYGTSLCSFPEQHRACIAIVQKAQRGVTLVFPPPPVLIIGHFDHVRSDVIRRKIKMEIDYIVPNSKKDDFDYRRSWNIFCQYFYAVTGVHPPTKIDTTDLKAGGTDQIPMALAEGRQVAGVGSSTNHVRAQKESRLPPAVYTALLQGLNIAQPQQNVALHGNTFGNRGNRPLPADVVPLAEPPNPGHAGGDGEDAQAA